jgi:hypothetical protein
MGCAHQIRRANFISIRTSKIKAGKFWILSAFSETGARGGAVVEALRYKPEGPGSIPDGVIGIFHWHNPSGRTMILGSTQPVTEMSTRNISWG